MKFIIVMFIILFSASSNAADVGIETGLELPRYVSLKSNESNIRVGPSKNYPISIKYVVKNFPIKIVDEYKDWRKVIDFQENTGWIHKSLIKGERNGIVISSNKENIYLYNSINGKKIGEVTHGSIVNLSKCKLNWCLINKNKFKGWIPKNYLWGVKKNEKFNIRFFQIFLDYYFTSINLLNKYLS